MPIDPPPEPPSATEQAGKFSGEPIADMREAFARKAPQTEEDRARAQAFIDGRIEMVRRDPHMAEEQKAAAISDLEARR
jgi:hypothetical protein